MEHQQEFRRLISSGADQFGLFVDEEALSKFESYLEELTLWNKKINLTSLVKEIDIAVNLFVDSLACGLVLSPERKESILDIGSGGGFPGIPLKITAPELHVTLLEPRFKKTVFLHHIIGTLNLEDIEVQQKRVEDVGKDLSFHGMYDFLVTKAVNPEPIIPLGPLLLKTSGKMVLFRSQSINLAGQTYGMRLMQEVPYELPSGFGRRILSILEPY